MAASIAQMRKAVVAFATWVYTMVAFIVFLAFSVVGYAGTHRDPDFSEFAGIDPVWRAENIDTRNHWWESANKANQIAATHIFTNNIQVTFYAFAYGALFGVGTLYVMAFNGAMMGAVLSLTYHAGFGNALVTFMVGHGVIELSCIFISGGAGLLIGSALLMPGDLSRADALKSRGLDAIRLVAGCVPLLVVAGTIEGFISPAPINPVIKFGIAGITGLAMYSYLIFAGRE
jgi:uncharacterized membrane protein SpoIIM required for sporulation